MLVSLYQLHITFYRQNIKNDELGRMRWEAIVACFEALPQNLPEETEVNHENLSLEAGARTIIQTQTHPCVNHYTKFSR
jgi:hypothetical protein